MLLSILISISFLLSGTFTYQPMNAVNSSGPTGESIPLESVFSTTGQKELNLARRGLANDKERSVLEDFERKHRTRTSAAFVVKGGNLVSAIEATFGALVLGRTADLPVVSAVDLDSKKNWLFTYLGAGPGGTEFFVDSVVHTPKSIRLSFHRKVPTNGQLIVVQHYYWAPIGELSSGTYVVELFDSDSKVVAYSRRIKIP